MNFGDMIFLLRVNNIVDDLLEVAIQCLIYIARHDYATTPAEWSCLLLPTWFVFDERNSTTFRNSLRRDDADTFMRPV
jgi:hypothetical protein